MKVVIYGEPDREPVDDNVSILMAHLIDPESELLAKLIRCFPRFEFDARTDFSRIFSSVVRCRTEDLDPIQYLLTKQDSVAMLVDCYNKDSAVALTGGLMLRECIKSERVSRLLLTRHLDALLSQAEVTSFDISSDAFATLKQLLTTHRKAVAAYIGDHYDEFFARYARLLESANYVTRRQSVKLLAELLLDQNNFALMKRYIANADNLKLMMKLLIDQNKSIQYEAFHVFKVFVANPKKQENEGVCSILIKNRDKLVSYLEGFQDDRDAHDEQFKDEKSLLIRELRRL